MKYLRIKGQNQMARKIQEMVAEIGADLGSPEVIAQIDQAIEALVGLRKVAVGLYGGASKPPPVEYAPDDRDKGSVVPSIQRVNEFEGTLKDLVARYIEDKGFLGLRFKTREHYMILMKEIAVEFGEGRRISDIKSQDIQGLYKNWTQNRGEAMAHSLLGMFRRLIYFGATSLRDEPCERLGMYLHRMKFAVPKSTAGSLNREQADAIRAASHKLDRASLALGQAFQFECDLSQTDTIGQWVPLSEEGEAILEYGGSKWLRGLRWEEIDGDLNLNHLASKSQKQVRIDLKTCPMVMEELALKYGQNFTRADLPWTGPILVSEVSGVPWAPQEYRRYWRKAANLAGVPGDVKNYSSRTFVKAKRGDVVIEDWPA